MQWLGTKDTMNYKQEDNTSNLLIMIKNGIFVRAIGDGIPIT